MSAKTGIEWCTSTWNPVVGCTKTSPGCRGCYAKELHDRRYKAFHAGKNVLPQYAEPFEKVQLKPERMMMPLRWREPGRIFVNSVSDLFHHDVPFQFAVDVFGVMLLAYWHEFLVLTKRAERELAFIQGGDHGIVRQMELLMQNGGVSTKPVFRALDRRRRDNVPLTWPIPNARIGVSIENQDFANLRFPAVCEIGEMGWNTMVSLEPLLGPVDIPDRYLALANRAWVIVGGESGKRARPLNLAWVRRIVAQCRAAGVACFVKQLGAVPMISEEEWRAFPSHAVPILSARNRQRVPEGFVPLAITGAKGGDMDQWPNDLRRREFPHAA